MQCERLMKLAKSWYIHVREETMAPARMISFMEKHAAECPVCQEDPDLPGEIAKITEMILVITSYSIHYTKLYEVNV